MKTGCLYSTRASTIWAPNLSTSWYMSRVPPEKPRQFAKIISGKFSPRLKSRIAVAVLEALSGNQTCPACGSRTSMLAGFAGSAGTRRSTFRVSTAMTPMGMPPSFARPTTTLLPQPSRYSWKLPSSKKPLTRAPSGPRVPASMCRGSYGIFVWVKATSLSTGSIGSKSGGGLAAVLGVYDNQSKMALTPSWSLCTSLCVTPLGTITWGPPNWSCDEYTFSPKSLFNAPKPVKIIGPLTIWITRWPSLFKYAPIPTERPVT
mmetsp:Transcript_91067/g.278769  ORF Transcript_91067/g.278769 Transcript_91067/m.278769 type:complete len:261 (+) Transcript_91067:860-1642(+)